MNARGAMPRTGDSKLVSAPIIVYLHGIQVTVAHGDC